MKKILSMLLVVAMLISMFPTAFAAEQDSGEARDYTYGTQVVYEAKGSESYTITVPAKLSPGQNGTVTLSGTWPNNRVVTVTADKTVTLTNSIRASDQKILDVKFAGISEAGDNISSQTFTKPISVDNIANAIFGTWSGKFNYNVEIKAKGSSITVVAKDVNGVDLNATANDIVGAQKDDLLGKLELGGLIDYAKDVDALIEVKSDEFDDIADTTFDVSSIAKEGDKVVILHFDEEKQQWEFISEETVDAEGKINADFKSYSPVAFVVVKPDGSTELIIPEVAQDPVYFNQPYNYSNGTDVYTAYFVDPTLGLSDKPFVALYENGFIVTDLGCVFDGNEVSVLNGETVMFTGIISDDRTKIEVQDLSVIGAESGTLTLNTNRHDLYTGAYGFSIIDEGAVYTITATFNEDGSALVVSPDGVETIPAGYLKIEDYVFIDATTNEPMGLISFDGTQINMLEFILTLRPIKYDDEFAIEWNSVDIFDSGNARGTVDSMPVVKISNLTPGQSDMEKAIMAVNGTISVNENGETTTESIDYEYSFEQVAQGNNVYIYAAVGEMDSMLMIVAQDACVTEIDGVAVEIPEEGMYAIDLEYLYRPIGLVSNLDFAIYGEYELEPNPVGWYMCTSESMLIEPDNVDNSNGNYIITKVTTLYMNEDLSWTRYLDGVLYDNGIATRSGNHINLNIPGLNVQAKGIISRDQIIFTDETWLAFGGVNCLTKMDLNNVGFLDCGIGETNRYMLGYTDDTESFTIPETFVGQDGFNYRVVEICAEAFSSQKNLTNIIIPTTVTKIGYCAFEWCDKLDDVVIPNSVTHIYATAFRYCKNLSEITIEDNVVYVGEKAFYGCQNLASVTVNAQKIGEEAFGGCNGLSNVVIGNNVSYISHNAFKWSDNIVSITSPNGNSNYSIINNCIINKSTKLLIQGCDNSVIPSDGSVTKIDEFAFSDCDGLTNVTIPSTVTEIGHNAFSGCAGLTSIAIPDSVTSIGDRAFYECTGLTSITIGKGLTEIAYGVFGKCSKISQITIPQNIKCIGQSAFFGCDSLTSVTVEGSKAWTMYLYEGAEGEAIEAGSSRFLSYLTAGTEFTRN